MGVCYAVGVLLKGQDSKPIKDSLQNSGGIQQRQGGNHVRSIAHAGHQHTALEPDMLIQRTVTHPLMSHTLLWCAGAVTRALH